MVRPRASASALVCRCDLRFVAADAKLTTAHECLNLPAEFGLSWLLPRLIGLTHANDLLLSSRVFLGREAGDLGLANRVVDEAQRRLNVMMTQPDYAEGVRAFAEKRAPRWGQPPRAV